MITIDGKTYYTEKEALEVLKIVRSTLYFWRRNGVIPFIKRGGRVLFLEEDVKAANRGVRIHNPLKNN